MLLRYGMVSADSRLEKDKQTPAVQQVKTELMKKKLINYCLTKFVSRGRVRSSQDPRLKGRAK